MKPAATLAAYALALALAFGAGAAAGELLGPIETGDTPTHGAPNADGDHDQRDHERSGD